jgi:excisionase family DNA binding protein
MLGLIMSSNLIDMPTVADRLGVNVRHVRRLVDERRIPFTKVGRLVRFDPVKLAKWIEENSISPS